MNTPRRDRVHPLPRWWTTFRARPPGSRQEMEAANGSIVEACRQSPRADNMLVRHVVFSTRVYDDTQRGHGWKPLPGINPGDYHRPARAPDDLTALYDATLNAIEVTVAQGDDMRNSGYDVNACIFVKTDGLNNSSTATVKMIREALDRARQDETLQSILMVLIGSGSTSATPASTPNWRSSRKTPGSTSTSRSPTPRPRRSPSWRTSSASRSRPPARRWQRKARASRSTPRRPDSRQRHERQHHHLKRWSLAGTVLKRLRFARGAAVRL
jgi:hypothetical protein